MSRETIAIDLNKARDEAIDPTIPADAAAINHLMEIANSTEQSLHPELKAFYDAISAASSGGEEISAERAQSYRESLERSVKSSGVGTAEKASILNVTQRKVGKIAAIAALQIPKEASAITTEKASTIKAAIDAVIVEYNEDLHRQVELDQNRNTFSLRKDGITHTINMPVGSSYEDLKGVLNRNDTEFGLNLTKEQIEYTMSRVDQATMAGPPIWWQMQNDNKTFRQTTERSLLVDITPEGKVNIYLNSEFEFGEIMDESFPGRILSTTKHDITGLTNNSEDFIMRPGLATSEVPITYMHTTFSTPGIEVKFNVPESVKATYTKDPLHEYYDVSVKAVATDKLNTIENQLAFISKNKFHTNATISALARDHINSPIQTSELISHYAAANGLSTEDRDSIFSDVISNIPQNDYAAVVLTEQIKRKTLEAGGTISFDSIATTICTTLEKRVDDRIIDNVLMQLEMGHRQIEDMHSIILNKQRRDGIISLDEAKARLVKSLGIKEPKAEERIREIDKKNKTPEPQTGFSKLLGAFKTIVSIKKLPAIDTALWSPTPELLSPSTATSSFLSPDSARSPSTAQSSVSVVDSPEGRFASTKRTDSPELDSITATPWPPKSLDDFIASPPTHAAIPASSRANFQSDAAETVPASVVAEAKNHPAISSISSSVAHIPHHDKASTPKQDRHKIAHLEREQRSKSAPPRKHGAK